MDKFREKMIATALGITLYEYSLVNAQFPEKMQARIRQRVRELCKEQKLFFSYELIYHELSGEELHIINLGSEWLSLMDRGTEYSVLVPEENIEEDTEAAAWEEALLFLWEKRLTERKEK